jgi:thioredoxin reductase (NADPH)
MIYDCIVIGAGPAGLSAAIYLGMANKKTLLIHSGPMRTCMAAHIGNYLGIDEISGTELVERGLKQAERYGVEIVLSRVKKVEKGETFRVEAGAGVFSSIYLVVASGINDVLPGIDNLYEFMGESFYTCFDCDGYRMRGKKAVLVGNDDPTARLALAVKQGCTDKITIVAGKENSISPLYRKQLENEGIMLLEGEITHLNGENGRIESAVLDNGSVLECDCVLSNTGYTRNDSFLNGLELERNGKGYIIVDSGCESSLKGLFVAGPLNTGPDQAVVAAGQGALAALRVIDYDFKAFLEKFGKRI